MRTPAPLEVPLDTMQYDGSEAKRMVAPQDRCRGLICFRYPGDFDVNLMYLYVFAAKSREMFLLLRFVSDLESFFLR